jgi:hypothetical protein
MSVLIVSILMICVCTNDRNYHPTEIVACRHVAPSHSITQQTTHLQAHRRMYLPSCRPYDLHSPQDAHVATNANDLHRIKHLRMAQNAQLTMSS